ncbi:hypothetical protein D9M69_334240 [compost metagenome]
MFSAPTMASPSAAVISSPANRLASTATISRAERSASHRISTTTSTVSAPLSAAPSLTEANSSSASACGPVSRTVAW